MSAEGPRTFGLPRAVLPALHPTPDSVALPPLPSPFVTEGAIFIQPSRIPNLEDEANKRGFEHEQRVGQVLSSLPYVESVMQADNDSPENANLTDLVVKMIPEFAIPIVNVQVKSSSYGCRAFYREVARRMRHEGIPGGGMGEESHHQKLEWMAARRLVLINGGVKDDQPVSDEYIVQKFIDQVRGIVAHERRITGNLSSDNSQL